MFIIKGGNTHTRRRAGRRFCKRAEEKRAKMGEKNFWNGQKKMKKQVNVC